MLIVDSWKLQQCVLLLFLNVGKYWKNVSKNTTDKQVCPKKKKSCKCSLYFYSGSITEIILAVMNFAFLRKAAASAPARAQRPEIALLFPRLTRRSWFAWSHSTWRRTRAGRRSCRRWSTSCTCTTSVWQTSPRRRCCRGWAAAWTSTGSARTRTTRRRPSWASPSKQEVRFLLGGSRADFFSCLSVQDPGWRRV